MVRADSRTLLLPNPASPSTNSAPPRPARAAASTSATAAVTSLRSHNWVPPIASRALLPQVPKRYDERRMLPLRLGPHSVAVAGADDAEEFVLRLRHDARRGPRGTLRA